VKIHFFRPSNCLFQSRGIRHCKNQRKQSYLSLSHSYIYTLYIISPKAFFSVSPFVQLLTLRVPAVFIQALLNAPLRFSTRTTLVHPPFLFSINATTLLVSISLFVHVCTVKLCVSMGPGVLLGASSSPPRLPFLLSFACLSQLQLVVISQSFPYEDTPSRFLPFPPTPLFSRDRPPPSALSRPPPLQPLPPPPQDTSLSSSFPSPTPPCLSLFASRLSKQILRDRQRRHFAVTTDH